MKSEKIINIRTDELRSLLDSYMKIFCKDDKEISESNVSFYYEWIHRAESKVGGGTKYPFVRVFKDDIEEMKRIVKNGK